MLKEDVVERFKATGALLEGHFILSSGLHSTKYLQCALVLQYPTDAQILGSAIADQFQGRGIELVAAPAIGGLVIGHEVARALNARFIWTERDAGTMTLRRGFSVKPNERTLIVEDVVTTGGSTRETVAALHVAGADVLAAASIIDRSDGEADVGVSRISLVKLAVPSFDPAVCELCRQGVPAVKPGSRKA